RRAIALPSIIYVVTAISDPPPERPNMSRAALPLFGLGSFLALLLVCYRPVLFEDGQFAMGVSTYFYYPLYLRVQQEWDAGRWPLWDSSPQPSVIYGPLGSILEKRLENPARSWNNGGGNTSSSFQGRGAFE